MPSSPRASRCSRARRRQGGRQGGGGASRGVGGGGGDGDASEARDTTVPTPEEEEEEEEEKAGRMHLLLYPLSAQTAAHRVAARSESLGQLFRVRTQRHTKLRSRRSAIETDDRYECAADRESLNKTHMRAERLARLAARGWTRSAHSSATRGANGNEGAAVAEGEAASHPRRLHGCLLSSFRSSSAGFQQRRHKKMPRG